MERARSPGVQIPVKEDRFVAKIAKAKKKARSELELTEWNRYGSAKETTKFWEVEDTMERIHQDEVSTDEFIERFEAPGLPVVIQGVTKTWAAGKNWTLQNLVAKYGQYRFKCGEDDDGYGVYMKLKYYLKYAQETEDDSPLYIFDSGFGDRMGPHDLLHDYELPKYFRDDLFRLAGEKKRPPYRWIVIGPPRSGTNIHIDPLGTSAWNTLIQGHKRWALFPPSTPKSLVDPPKMEDEAIVWFQRVYPQTLLDTWPGPKPITIIQRPGETVFVPGGWWHVVMNLDMTVAITQNFCSVTNFEQVWLKARSSRPKFSRKLAERLKIEYPHVFAKIHELSFIPNMVDSSSSSSSSSSEESDTEKKNQSGTKLTVAIRLSPSPSSPSDSKKRSDSEGSDAEGTRSKKKSSRKMGRKEADLSDDDDQKLHDGKKRKTAKEETNQNLSA